MRRRAERGQPKPVCEGSKCFVQRMMGGTPPGAPHRPKRRFHPISDKRHFAGEKAADTRLRNQVAGLIARLRRTIKKENRLFRPKAPEKLRDLEAFIYGWFGWEKKP